MRIIAGEFRSRRLFTPKDDSVTRPMPDRVKVSLFGLLRGNCEGASVFDGFAGTGAIGLEAVSRGAARCVFAEKDKHIVKILERNIEALGAGDRCEVVHGDALGPGALSRCPRPVDLVFLDPPYPLVRDAAGWGRVRTQFMRLIDLLSDGGFAVLRTPWPFTHESGSQAEVEPEPMAKGRDKRQARAAHRGGHPAAKGGRRSGRPPADEEVIEVSIDDGDGRSLEEILEEKLAEIEIAAAPKPRPGVPVDLALPNAVGPETHVYHSMAVHLYMRKRA
jgi:16S rRNA (guanine(966)-N(2))-methyltransferase RsmD